eukprot:SAG11_NODE_93_length_17080_cov_10.504093_5_plen_129_part_00
MVNTKESSAAKAKRDAANKSNAAAGKPQIIRTKQKRKGNKCCYCCHKCIGLFYKFFALMALLLFFLMAFAALLTKLSMPDFDFGLLFDLQVPPVRLPAYRRTVAAATCLLMAWCTVLQSDALNRWLQD